MTLHGVRIGGHLQQRIALRQPQIGIAAGSQQLLHAGRIVARHRERERRPAAIDVARVRRIELAAVTRRIDSDQIGVKAQGAQLARRPLRRRRRARRRARCSRGRRVHRAARRRAAAL